MTDSVCNACLGTWPRQDHFIADCGLTRAYLHDDQFFPGWTVLVLKRHATELFHLSREERGTLIEEVAQVASLLADEWRAVKINYELLGNQLPHIHWHLIPRLSRDPAPLEPVWRVAHDPVRLQPDALASMIERLTQRWPTQLDHTPPKA
ncbi:MAG: HIT family protein [Nitrospira sp.]|nr:HIT family protein [Nitrospira sp.]MBS0162052.1 HIT family protein [Nitrospira sp.]MBS0172452.1 HIT family protein [Nitrospira sp.]MBX3338986.1 HIT family protein [Nitrospira sp.]MCW5781574.1 HIT family protein [Nitrospira sp.]